MSLKNNRNGATDAKENSDKWKVESDKWKKQLCPDKSGSKKKL